MKLIKLNKKGLSFDTINKGLVSFIGFVLITMLVVLLVLTVKQTNIICPVGYDDDECFECPTNYDYNSSSNNCCNSTGTPYDCAAGNITSRVAYDGAAYNATLDMQEAAALPPQFAQIIVIVVIIVGILILLTAIGYSTYQKMKK